MLEAVRHNGGRVDKAYFCPHRPDENCKCRKPETGMLDLAAKDFDIDFLGYGVWYGYHVTKSDEFSKTMNKFPTISHEQSGKGPSILDHRCSS